MNTSTIIGVIVALGIAIGAWYWLTAATPAMAEYKNSTYIIDGQSVTLINGKAEVASAPGSATKTVTEYFGNEAVGDLNGDSTPDVAFILTQTSGGSGTFYYVVGAIKTPGGYQGTSAVLLGDRIAPQTTEIKDGKVIVNYADRAQGESFTVQPSVGKSLVLLLDPGSMQFGEVVQNFEGEANPESMTLDMKTWTWITALYSNDTVVTPKKENAFTLTFKKDGSVAITTDCNSSSGTYVAKDDTLTFSQMMVSTRMFCEGSQENVFHTMLQAVKKYHFTSKGELVFDLTMDSGTVIFR
jgi:heat shock protein HslJ